MLRSEPHIAIQKYIVHTGCLRIRTMLDYRTTMYLPWEHCHAKPSCWKILVQREYYKKGQRNVLAVVPEVGACELLQSLGRNIERYINGLA